jgi:phosphoglycolate phosphatase-like HAD superfamily hydrolase
MAGILSADGKALSSETFKVGDFEFDLQSAQNNPMMAVMTLIALDPTEKQKEFLNGIGLVIKDTKGNIVFPIEEVTE